MKRYYEVYKEQVFLFIDTDEFLSQYNLSVKQEAFKQFEINIRGKKGVALIPTFQDLFNKIANRKGLVNYEQIIDMCHDCKIYKI